MIKATLSQIQAVLQGQLVGKDAEFTGVSIDSRTVKKDELFIAVKGLNHDGHEHLQEAYQKGAKAALVSRKQSCPLPQLVVKDTRIALGDLARWYRQQFHQPIASLTGSCGKTTTKALIANILQQVGKTHATVGTLNNDYGVPLTLLRLPLDSAFAVIEMGANHLNEIAYLTHIVQPDIALITNAGPVHLEGFKSIEGVAQGKGEIFQGLRSDGIAVINLDDAMSDYWLSLLAGQRYVTFAIQNPQADVRAEDIRFNEEGKAHFTLLTLSDRCTIQLPLLGEHNLYNAVAAAAVATALGVSIEAIKIGLETAVPVDKRFVEKLSKQGAAIIDDTYNANPVAMEMALKVLSKKQGKKILVIGDMKELGENNIFYHEQLGQQARDYGIDKLYAVGEFTPHTVKSFGENAYHFPNQQSLVEALQGQLTNNVTVLVKGSRGARMENVINALVT